MQPMIKNTFLNKWMKKSSAGKMKVDENYKTE
jgi:hypothetical protein